MSSKYSGKTSLTNTTLDLNEYDKLFHKINNYLIGVPNNKCKVIDFEYEEEKKSYLEISVELEENFKKEMKLKYELETNTNLKQTSQQKEGDMYEAMISKLLDFNLSYMEKIPRIYAEKRYYTLKQCSENNFVHLKEDKNAKEEQRCQVHFKYEYCEFDILFKAKNQYFIDGLVKSSDNTKRMISVQEKQIYTFEIKRSISMIGILNQCDRIHSVWNGIFAKKITNDCKLYCYFFYNNKYAYSADILYLVTFLNSSNKDKTIITNSIKKIEQSLKIENANSNEVRQKTFDKRLKYWLSAIRFIQKNIANKKIAPIELYYYDGEVILDQIVEKYEAKSKTNDAEWKAEMKKIQDEWKAKLKIIEDKLESTMKNNDKEKLKINVMKLMKKINEKCELYSVIIKRIIILVTLFLLTFVIGNK